MPATVRGAGRYRWSRPAHTNQSRRGTRRLDERNTNDAWTAGRTWGHGAIVHLPLRPSHSRRRKTSWSALAVPPEVENTARVISHQSPLERVAPHHVQHITPFHFHPVKLSHGCRHEEVVKFPCNVKRNRPAPLQGFLVVFIVGLCKSGLK